MYKKIIELETVFCQMRFCTVEKGYTKYEPPRIENSFEKGIKYPRLVSAIAFTTGYVIFTRDAGFKKYEPDWPKGN